MVLSILLKKFIEVGFVFAEPLSDLELWILISNLYKCNMTKERATVVGSVHGHLWVVRVANSYPGLLFLSNVSEGVFLWCTPKECVILCR